MSTTKNPASFMMIVVTASIEKKMPAVYFEQGYKQTCTAYKTGVGNESSSMGQEDH